MVANGNKALRASQDRARIADDWRMVKRSFAYVIDDSCARLTGAIDVLPNAALHIPGLF